MALCLPMASELLFASIAKKAFEVEDGELGRKIDYFGLLDDKCQDCIS